MKYNKGNKQLQLIIVLILLGTYLTNGTSILADLNLKVHVCVSTVSTFVKTNSKALHYYNYYFDHWKFTTATLLLILLKFNYKQLKQLAKRGNLQG